MCVNHGKGWKTESLSDTGAEEKIDLAAGVQRGLKLCAHQIKTSRKR